MYLNGTLKQSAAMPSSVTQIPMQLKTPVRQKSAAKQTPGRSRESIGLQNSTRLSTGLPFAKVDQNLAQSSQRKSSARNQLQVSAQSKKGTSMVQGAEASVDFKNSIHMLSNSPISAIDSYRTNGVSSSYASNVQAQTTTKKQPAKRTAPSTALKPTAVQPALSSSRNTHSQSIFASTKNRQSRVTPYTSTTATAVAP